MQEITAAITAKHAQIKTLQADIEALQRAANVLAGKRTGRATSQPKLMVTRKRRGMSAAAKKAVSKRMKAYWAKRT